MEHVLSVRLTAEGSDGQEAATLRIACCKYVERPWLLLCFVRCAYRDQPDQTPHRRRRRRRPPPRLVRRNRTRKEGREMRSSEAMELLGFHPYSRPSPSEVSLSPIPPLHAPRESPTPSHRMIIRF
jgi:hypothetical protein